MARDWTGRRSQRDRWVREPCAPGTGRRHSPPAEAVTRKKKKKWLSSVLYGVASRRERTAASAEEPGPAARYRGAGGVKWKVNMGLGSFC